MKTAEGLLLRLRVPLPHNSLLKRLRIEAVTVVPEMRAGTDQMLESPGAEPDVPDGVPWSLRCGQITPAEAGAVDAPGA